MGGEERFEGLGLVELLDRMHDVVEPEPVSLWPATIGWWVLLGWLAAVGVLLLWRARRRWVADRYRREALAALEAMARPSGRALGELLRRTALAVYPREAVAGLHGDAWAAFLVRSAGGDPVIAEAAPRLARAPYREDADVAALVGPVRRWILRHRA